MENCSMNHVFIWYFLFQTFNCFFQKIDEPVKKDSYNMHNIFQEWKKQVKIKLNMELGS